jgi:hypothetical protein
MFLPKGFLLMMACIAGCKEGPSTPESLLRDHVRACGAGFSDELQSSLSDSLLIHSLKNTFEAGFKVQAKELIFEELPPKDRLKAYEDYLECIEKDPDFTSP